MGLRRRAFRRRGREDRRGKDINPTRRIAIANTMTSTAVPPAIVEATASN